MLSLYRRHTRRCRDKRQLRSDEVRRCSCPLWVIGTDSAGGYHRHSLATNDYHIALARLNEIESGAKAVDRVGIKEAIERYRQIQQTQNGLRESSLRTIKSAMERPLAEFAASKGIKFLDQVTTDLLDEWISTWNLQPSTAACRLSWLRRFFKSAHSRGWIAHDPTLAIAKPKYQTRGVTAPFDLETEDPKIIEAASHWEDGIRNRRQQASVWAANPRTAEALILVLRYTGLRISDAIRFEPRALKKMGDVWVYFHVEQQKTGEPVFVPIPEEIAQKIRRAPRLSEQYAFWDGTTPAWTWTIRFIQSCLVFLERTSGVPNIRPHRFRNTFAVDLLNRGVDIRAVSRMLGHRQVGTTLRYYEHWLPQDRRRLVEAITSAWGVSNFTDRQEKQ